MPRLPTHKWIERTVRDKYAREKLVEPREWNLLAREVKLIADRQDLILKRFGAYGEKLHNLEQEVYITYNAANNGFEEIAGVKNARRVVEVKVLKTFDFMENKLDYIQERIDKLEGNKSNNIE